MSPSSLDLWYQEKHNNEISFGLHVKSVLFTEQSPFQRVDVLDTTGFGRILVIDGLMMCTERDEFVYHDMISHVPLCTHPNPKRVLVIGGGDGGTVREVCKHDSVQEVVLCEIDECVIRASRQHLPTLACALDDPRVLVHVADGIEYVKNQPAERFDVVIVDSTDPFGPGEGLFSPEFYTHVHRILSPQGIVVAQCESPWEEKLPLDRVYANIHAAFSRVSAMVGPVISYPYGFWSWGIACKDAAISFPNTLQEERSQKIALHARYYNTEVHKAAFALPNFFKNKLKGINMANPKIDLEFL